MKLHYEVPTMCAMGLTVLEIELELNSIIMPPQYMCIDILFHNEAPKQCVLLMNIIGVNQEYELLSCST